MQAADRPDGPPVRGMLGDCPSWSSGPAETWVPSAIDGSHMSGSPAAGDLAISLCDLAATSLAYP